MSFAASAGGIISSVVDLSGLFKTTVRLGDFVFSDIEVPERITWGGTQRMVRHVAPGGGVTLSTMGIEYEPLQWGAIFEGSAALERARQLYLLKVRGQVLPLSWLDKSYQVVIREFHADDTTAGWVPYRIVCDVLFDNLFGPPQEGGSLIGDLLADLQSALAIADVAADVMGAMEQALMLASAVVSGSADTLALQSDNADAIAQLQAATAAREASVDALALLAPDGALLPSGDATAAASDLLALVGEAQSLANDTLAAAYLGRLAVNLGRAGS